MNESAFCSEAIKILSQSPHFGDDFCRLKIEFFRKFQNGIVFSTRFGAKFFEDVLDLIESKKYIVPEPGTTLGEYDKNINKWLKTL